MIDDSAAARVATGRVSGVEQLADIPQEMIPIFGSHCDERPMIPIFGLHCDERPD
jgi:hypothetical protein